MSFSISFNARSVTDAKSKLAGFSESSLPASVRAFILEALDNTDTSGSPAICVSAHGHLSTGKGSYSNCAADIKVTPITF